MKMPANLVHFILTYVGFFANNDYQEKIWRNHEPWESAPYDEWIRIAVDEWASIRGELAPLPIVRDIDSLHEKLIAYVKEMQVFPSDYVHKIHSRILSDPKWLKLQRQALEIFNKTIS